MRILFLGTLYMGFGKQCSHRVAISSTTLLFCAALWAQFLPERYLSSVANPPLTNIAKADLDGDGIQDLIMDASGTLSFLPGATPDMEAPFRSIGSGASTSYIYTADMDQDGDLDVIVYNAIFENLGQGVLWNSHALVTGVQVIHAVTDLDNDGDIDLVVRAGNGFHVMFNQGYFAFNAPVLIETGIAISLFVWDPDGNGVKDLLAQKGTTVYHYANTGTGAFAAPVSLITGIGNLSALEDMDNDGDLDILSMIPSSVKLHSRTGPLQFAAPIDLQTGSAYDAGAVNRTVYDLDSDGDKDIIISMPTNLGASYLRNDGGGVYKWTGESIAHLHGVNGAAYAMTFMDMDLDTDPDMVYVNQSGELYWQENKGGPGFDTRPIHSGATLTRTPIHVDLNGDGMMDVLVSSNSVYRWCRNTGNGVFAAPVVLAQTASDQDHFADADGDGLVDLFTWISSAGNSTASWKRNLGNGVFGSATTLYSIAGYFPLEMVADIDGDGDEDVLSFYAYGQQRWYLNNGNGIFSSSSLIIYSGYEFDGLMDMDGDGDMDPYFAEQFNDLGEAMCRFGYARNNGGTSFTMVSAERTIGVNGLWWSYDGSMLDVDRDGRLDVLFYTVVPESGDARLIWYRNVDPGWDYWPITVYSVGFNAASIGDQRLADVDDDGDLDLIAGASVILNIGQGLFGYPQQLANIQANELRVVPGDLNNDGAIDLTIWCGTEEVRWTQFLAENDLAGGSHPLVIPRPGTYRSAVDLDLDGDLDVLHATGWFENDGNANFTEHVVDGLYRTGLNIWLAADLDGDSDLDLIAADGTLGIMAWMERLPGNVFAEPRSIAPFNTGVPTRTGDLDGDGDIDIMVSPFGSSNGKWLRNMGAGTFQVVSLTSRHYAQEIGDFDGDGDLDMVGIYPNFSSWYLAIFANNGAGAFTLVSNFSNTYQRPAGTFADLDGDGDLDFAFGQQGVYYGPNQGGGTIQTIRNPVGGGGVDFLRIICKDHDGDGDLDVYAIGLYWCFLYLNSGSATFSNGGSYSFGGLRDGGDMNGDGVLDLLGDQDGRLWVALGTQGQVALSVSAMLGGPFATATEHNNDNLRSAGLLPLVEPYTAAGYTHIGGGGESISAARLQVLGANAFVDWVVVELRDPNNPAQRVAARSGLLQRDGSIVDVDGVSPLTFDVPAGNYHVAVLHRNHLPVMTASPIALSTAVGTIDFTNPATATYGTNAQQNINGTMVLWPGDANFNGEVRYTGTGNDRDLILVAIGGTTPINTVTNTYSPLDINMDGTIRYTGTNNDRDIILQTIGGVVPTATRVEQLP